MKKIYFTVTNDLIYDQRMHRICNTLAENGYSVTLIGRRLPTSLPLTEKRFKQKRIRCLFNKTKWFYAEYNMRLFFYLLLKKMDAICAIDLDTILPCLYISRLKKIPRIYDAHELFTEMKEVISRPAIQKVWAKIEKRVVPKFSFGYTVSESIANEFHQRYSVNYLTIRNLPALQPIRKAESAERFLLYQGAVNEARGLEYLIPAMQSINYKLMICGDGNFMQQLKNLISEYNLESKIELTGMLTPGKLADISQKAYIGIAVPEKTGLNQYLALPNKLFDYIHAGLPQVTVNYPEYQKINSQFEIAILLEDITPASIAATVNNLMEDEALYAKLKTNCLKAREILNWQLEEKKLLQFYQGIFNN